MRLRVAPSVSFDHWSFEQTSSISGWTDGLFLHDLFYGIRGSFVRLVDGNLDGLSVTGALALATNEEVVACIGSTRVAVDDGTGNPQVTELQLSLKDIAYGNGRFVIVGPRWWTGLEYETTVFTSEDGNGWTYRPTMLPSGFTSINFQNGQFIATTQGGGIYLSDDGVNWTTLQPEGGLRFDEIAAMEGVYLARSGAELYRSNNGTDWTRVMGRLYVRRLISASGLFAIIRGDGNNSVMTSRDGITWETTAQFHEFSIQSLFVHDDRWFVIGDGIWESSGLSRYESWQRRWLSPEELQDPSISGPLADPAGIGRSNLLSYASDVSPFSGMGAGTLAPLQRSVLKVPWHRADGGSPVVEVSYDGGENWESGAGNVELIKRIQLPDQSEELWFLPTTATDPSDFRVTAPVP